MLKFRIDKLKRRSLFWKDSEKVYTVKVEAEETNLVENSTEDAIEEPRKQLGRLEAASSSPLTSGNRELLKVNGYEEKDTENLAKDATEELRKQPERIETCSDLPVTSSNRELIKVYRNEKKDADAQKNIKSKSSKGLEKKSKEKLLIDKNKELVSNVAGVVPLDKGDKKIAADVTSHFKKVAKKNKEEKLVKFFISELDEKPIKGKMENVNDNSKATSQDDIADHKKTADAINVTKKAGDVSKYFYDRIGDVYLVRQDGKSTKDSSEDAFTDKSKDLDNYEQKPKSDAFWFYKTNKPSFNNTENEKEGIKELTELLKRSQDGSKLEMQRSIKDDPLWDVSSEWMVSKALHGS